MTRGAERIGTSRPRLTGGLLLVLALATGPRADDFLGPHVSLSGTLTLAEAAHQFGSQVGCTVQTGGLPKASLERTATLNAKDLSPSAARAAIEAAFGITLRRWWRDGYGLENQPNTPGPALGQVLGPPLSGWTVWLVNLRCDLQASVRDRQGANVSQWGGLTPRIVIQTPSDAEALRIVGCSAPYQGGETPDAQNPADRRDHGLNNLIRWNNSNGDPSQWVLEQPLRHVAIGQKTLDRLCVDLHLTRLVAHHFVFEDLDQPGEQLQSDADLDVHLKVGKGDRDYQVRVDGVLPPGAGDTTAGLQWRDGMFSARLRDADNGLIPTSSNVTKQDQDKRGWHYAATVQRQGGNPARLPHHLVLTIYQAVEPLSVVTVDFRNVPLPPWS